MAKRARKKTKNLYWTQETEDAIIEYNNSDDELYRSRLFDKKIYVPLNKIAENIINRFKFPYMDGSFHDVQTEVVSYLVLKLPNFTADKGKSFSYFSVVAKNYLILQNNKKYKELKRYVSLTDDSPESFNLQETLIVDPAEKYHISDRAEFLNLFVDYWDENLHRLFKKERDLKVGYAILELFRRSHMIENFNKKAIYLMIREITDCQTSYITKIVKKMKDIMKEQQRIYTNTGKFPDYFTS